MIDAQRQSRPLPASISLQNTQLASILQPDRPLLLILIDGVLSSWLSRHKEAPMIQLFGAWLLLGLPPTFFGLNSAAFNLASLPGLAWATASVTTSSSVLSRKFVA